MKQQVSHFVHHHHHYYYHHHHCHCLLLLLCLFLLVSFSISLHHPPPNDFHRGSARKTGRAGAHEPRRRDKNPRAHVRGHYACNGDATRSAADAGAQKARVGKDERIICKKKCAENAHERTAPTTAEANKRILPPGL